MNIERIQAGFAINKQDLPFLRSKMKGGIEWHFLLVR